ncbi:MAG: ArsC family reductase [Mariprofundaceae bacterium]|nr:ArsC family reductase [Mariprofundaceae bacterium]
MTVHMYGIPNCDTIKKARKWLVEHDIDYVFHNYKKEGVDAACLQAWCAQVGWEILLNKRGTTWRKLPDADKNELNTAKAQALLVEHASMIKRPVLVYSEGAEKHVEVGFSAASYETLFQ